LVSAGRRVAAQGGRRAGHQPGVFGHAHQGAHPASPGVGRVSVWDQRVVVFGVAKLRQGQLPEVAQASGLVRFDFRPTQGRQQQGRKNADDGNDHEQLNPRKTTSSIPFHIDWTSALSDRPVSPLWRQAT